jgi:hypothetical protein
MVRGSIEPGLRDFRIYEEIWNITQFEGFSLRVHLHKNSLLMSLAGQYLNFLINPCNLSILV